MRQENELICPDNRVCHCMTSVREFLIIYGGYDNLNGVECNELWSYNTISGAWLQYLPPIEIKDTCVSSSICSVGNLVYIFGGDCFDGQNYRQTNSIVSFDITNATWDILYPHTNDYHPNTPPPMCENLLLYHDGFLYVLGGYHDFLNLDTVYKFSIKFSTWSLVPQTGVKPTFNSQFFGTVYKNQIYCFETPSTGPTTFRRIWIFDLSTHTWTSSVIHSTNHQYPENRYYQSLTFSGNIGFMSGGFQQYTTNTIHSDIWRIDLECLEWFKLEYCLKKSVYYHRMSVVDDYYLFIFGGFHSASRANTLERFTVQPHTLYRSCLETICHSPNVKIYTKSLPTAIEDELNLYNNDSDIDV